MLHPEKSDFTVTCDDACVVVTFRPTRSSYCFHRLADPHEPLSEPSELHKGHTGDTGEYWSHEVLDMARRLAEEAVRRLAA